MFPYLSPSPLTYTLLPISVMPDDRLRAEAALLSPFLAIASAPMMLVMEFVFFSSAITSLSEPSIFGASTTNSSSSILAGVKDTVREVLPSFATCTPPMVCALNAVCTTEILSGTPEGTSTENLPFASVLASTAVPLTNTLAPEIGVFPSDERMSPLSLPLPVTATACAVLACVSVPTGVSTETRGVLPRVVKVEMTCVSLLSLTKMDFLKYPRFSFLLPFPTISRLCCPAESVVFTAPSLSVV